MSKIRALLWTAGHVLQHVALHPPARRSVGHTFAARPSASVRGEGGIFFFLNFCSRRDPRQTTLCKCPTVHVDPWKAKQSFEAAHGIDSRFNIPKVGGQRGVIDRLESSTHLNPLPWCSHRRPSKTFQRCSSRPQQQGPHLRRSPLGPGTAERSRPWWTAMAMSPCRYAGGHRFKPAHCWKAILAHPGYKFSPCRITILTTLLRRRRGRLGRSRRATLRVRNTKKAPATLTSFLHVKQRSILILTPLTPLTRLGLQGATR